MDKIEATPAVEFLTREVRRAIQFKRKQEAVSAAKAIGWFATDATRIEVMGFLLWSIGDDHGNYVSREGYWELAKSRATLARSNAAPKPD